MNYHASNRNCRGRESVNINAIEPDPEDLDFDEIDDEETEEFDEFSDEDDWDEEE